MIDICTNLSTYCVSSSSYMHWKLLACWLIFILLDTMADFRFEYVYPAFMFARSVYDSYKYQGVVRKRSCCSSKEKIIVLTHTHTHTYTRTHTHSRTHTHRCSHCCSCIWLCTLTCCGCPYSLDPCYLWLPVLVFGLR